MRVPARAVTVADQVVSSASNFILVAVVARVSTPAEFGRFTLAYTVLIFLLGLQRSAVGEVLLLAVKEQAPVRQTSRIVGAAAVVGLAGAVVLAVGGLFVPGGQASWWTLAVAAPLVLAQDAVRYAFIAVGRSTHALLVDAVWLVVATTAMLGVARWLGAPVWVLLGWVGGAVVALAVGLVLVRSWPDPVGGLVWLRERRQLSARFSLEFAALNASTALVWFLLLGPLGAVGVAALRGASLLFSPLNTAFNAIRIAVTPDLRRRHGTATYGRGLAEALGVLLVLTVVAGGVVLLLPDRWGTVVLGATWPAAADLRLPYFAQAVVMVGYTVCLSHFRSSLRLRGSSVLRGLLAALTLVVPVSGALAFGVQGAAWGFAVAIGAATTVALLVPARPAGEAVRA